MKLGEMNWPDIRDLDKGNLVAVYPIASFEQHGLHLPLLTDTIQLDALVERMDGRLSSRIVCLPTQWLGYSFHHMNFGGSLTATSHTHIQMLVETIDGLIAAGFDKIWFGVFLVIVVEMAQITPPVGFNLFVIQGMTGEKIGRIAIATLPFFFIMAALAFLIAVVPDIVMFLPNNIKFSG